MRSANVLKARKAKENDQSMPLLASFDDEDHPMKQGRIWHTRQAGRGGMWIDAVCKCGTWILWGSLATPEEKAAPACDQFPFVALGAA